MDSEVDMILQRGENGVRNGSDAHLEAGAVVDKFRAVAADCKIQFGRRGIDNLHERVIVHDGVVDFAVGDRIRPRRQ